MADLASLSREKLMELIITLQQQIDDLRRQVETLQPSANRQVAPFSKGKLVEHPKPPGRKPGQGTFLHRPVPLEQASETNRRLEARKLPPLWWGVEGANSRSCDDNRLADSTSGDHQLSGTRLPVSRMWQNGAWYPIRLGSGSVRRDGPPRRS